MDYAMGGCGGGGAENQGGVVILRLEFVYPSLFVRLK